MLGIACCNPKSDNINYRVLPIKDVESIANFYCIENRISPVHEETIEGTNFKRLVPNKHSKDIPGMGGKALRNSRIYFRTKLIFDFDFDAEHQREVLKDGCVPMYDTKAVETALNSAYMHSIERCISMLGMPDYIVENKNAWEYTDYEKERYFTKNGVVKLPKKYGCQLFYDLKEPISSNHIEEMRLFNDARMILTKRFGADLLFKGDQHKNYFNKSLFKVNCGPVYKHFAKTKKKEFPLTIQYICDRAGLSEKYKEAKRVPNYQTFEDVENAKVQNRNFVPYANTLLNWYKFELNRYTFNHTVSFEEYLNESDEDARKFLTRLLAMNKEVISIDEINTTVEDCINSGARSINFSSSYPFVKFANSNLAVNTEEFYEEFFNTNIVYIKSEGRNNSIFNFMRNLLIQKGVTSVDNFSYKVLNSIWRKTFQNFTAIKTIIDEEEFETIKSSIYSYYETNIDSISVAHEAVNEAIDESEEPVAYQKNYDPRVIKYDNFVEELTEEAILKVCNKVVNHLMPILIEKTGQKYLTISKLANMESLISFSDCIFALFEKDRAFFLENLYPMCTERVFKLIARISNDTMYIGSYASSLKRAALVAHYAYLKELKEKYAKDMESKRLNKIKEAEAEKALYKEIVQARKEENAKAVAAAKAKAEERGYNYSRTTHTNDDRKEMETFGLYFFTKTIRDPENLRKKIEVSTGNKIGQFKKCYKKLVSSRLLDSEGKPFSTEFYRKHFSVAAKTAKEFVKTINEFIKFLGEEAINSLIESLFGSLEDFKNFMIDGSQPNEQKQTNPCTRHIVTNAGYNYYSKFLKSCKIYEKTCGVNY